MKMTVLMATCLLGATCTFANAAVCNDDPIDLNLGRFNPTSPHDPHPKSPIQIPLVYQDGNTLTFGSYIGACTLQLRDADGDVVYATTVAAGATSAILPDAALLGGSGTYELRLIFGDYYFYGDITLS